MEHSSSRIFWPDSGRDGESPKTSFSDPFSHFWSISFQNEIGKDVTLEASRAFFSDYIMGTAELFPPLLKNMQSALSGCKQLWGRLHRSQWTPTPRERGGSRHPCIWCRAFSVAQTVKNLPAIQETWIWSLSQEDPLEKGMATLPKNTPVFLPGEFHEQKSLSGYSPWHCKESDMTERLPLSLSWSLTKFYWRL